MSKDLADFSPLAPDRSIYAPATGHHATEAMGNFIDNESYAQQEEYHLGFKAMMQKILAWVREKRDSPEEHFSDKNPCKILEIGPGPGALTTRLAMQPGVSVTAVDIDEDAIKRLQQLQEKIAPKQKAFNAILSSKPTLPGEKPKPARLNPIKAIKQDARYFPSEKRNDIAVSTFAYDHFTPDDMVVMLKNVFENNLKDGGAYYVGGEFLPDHKVDDPQERAKALATWHGIVMKDAFEKGHLGLACIEMQALMSGLKVSVPHPDEINQEDPQPYNPKSSTQPLHNNKQAIIVLSSLLKDLKEDIEKQDFNKEGIKEGEGKKPKFKTDEETQQWEKEQKRRRELEEVQLRKLMEHIRGDLHLDNERKKHREPNQDIRLDYLDLVRDLCTALNDSNKPGLKYYSPEEGGDYKMTFDEYQELVKKAGYQIVESKHVSFANDSDARKNGDVWVARIEKRRAVAPANNTLG